MCRSWWMTFLVAVYPLLGLAAGQSNTSLCPSIDGYYLYEHYDSVYGDIGQLPSASITDAADACSNNPECVSFTSIGWLKRFIRPPEQWRRFVMISPSPFDSSCISLYVKAALYATPPRPPPIPVRSAAVQPNLQYEVPSTCATRIPGFVFYPGVDYNKMYPIKDVPYIRYAGTSYNYSAHEMAAACLREASCTGYSDWGYLYLTAPPPTQTWSPVSYFSWNAIGPCNGLYVRATHWTWGTLCHADLQVHAHGMAWLTIITFAGCPSIDGYAFYPDMSSVSGTYLTMNTSSVVELGIACNASSSCMAFTSWGELKGNLSDYQDWAVTASANNGLIWPGASQTCQGMYVKLPYAEAADWTGDQQTTNISAQPRPISQSTDTNVITSFIVPAAWSMDQNTVDIRLTGRVYSTDNTGGPATGSGTYNFSFVNSGKLLLLYGQNGLYLDSPWVPNASALEFYNRSMRFVNLQWQPGQQVTVAMETNNNGWTSIGVEVLLRWAGAIYMDTPQGQKDGTGGDSRSAAIGIGVGVGVGVPVLGLLVLSVLWFVRQRRSVPKTVCRSKDVEQANLAVGHLKMHPANSGSNPSDESHMSGSPVDPDNPNATWQPGSGMPTITIAHDSSAADAKWTMISQVTGADKLESTMASPPSLTSLSKGSTEMSEIDFSQAIALLDQGDGSMPGTLVALKQRFATNGAHLAPPSVVPLLDARLTSLPEALSSAGVVGALSAAGITGPSSRQSLWSESADTPPHTGPYDSIPRPNSRSAPQGSPSKCAKCATCGDAGSRGNTSPIPAVATDYAVSGSSQGRTSDDVSLEPRFPLDQLVLIKNAVLGSGAHGIVVAGLFHQQIPVAVKLFKQYQPGSFLSKETDKGLKHEANILGKTFHSNIVQLLGFNMLPPHLLLVEELMLCSLEEVLHSSKEQLRLQHVLTIACDMAAGLAHLHPNIVHRDLKPGNVLLDARGVAKISDFGLARIKFKTALSTTNAQAGTVCYMAPECFSLMSSGKSRTDPHLTERVDIFALGIVLWEMLTGVKPWLEAPNFIAVAVAVSQHGARPQLPPEDVCPPALRQIIEQCWHQNPSQRPTAAAVLGQLQALLLQMR